MFVASDTHSFSENFAYILNEWFIVESIMLVVYTILKILFKKN